MGKTASPIILLILQLIPKLERTTKNKRNGQEIDNGKTNLYVVIPFMLDVSLVDAPAEVTQEEDHT